MLGNENHSTGQRDQADRQVDVEHPAPAQVVGQVAAQQRPDDAGQAEDAAEDALDAAALGGREDLRDDGEDGRGQHAAGQALQAAEDDQLGHVLAQAAQRRGQHEQRRAAEQEQLAAVHVRQLAGDRHDRRAGQQVGRGDPGVVLEAVQLGDDARHRRADDGLVERRQQQAQHQARDGQDQVAARQRVEAGRSRRARLLRQRRQRITLTKTSGRDVAGFA